MKGYSTIGGNGQWTRGGQGKDKGRTREPGVMLITVILVWFDGLDGRRFRKDGEDAGDTELE